MRMHDEFLLKTTCVKEGRQKEYEDYVKAKKVNLRNIREYKREYENYQEKLKNTKHSPTSPEYKSLRNKMLRAKYALEKESLERIFIRPNKKEDIEERLEQCKNFAQKMKTLLPEDIPLRFHGTSIANTEQILKSKEISSASSRYEGFHSDGVSEISVTDVTTLDRTVGEYAGLLSGYKCLPAGCIFILRPQDKKDADLIKYASMKKIDFRKHPEQFVGIITTKENISRVKSWMRKYGYNEDFLYTYSSLINLLEMSKFEQELKEVKDDLKDEIDDNFDPQYEPEGMEEVFDGIEENIITDTITQINIRRSGR